MMDWTTLILYISTVSAIVFFPGPNTLYVIANSINQGRTAGFVSIFGIQLATLLHLFAAAFGLSALLLSSALAFNFVKYAGAIYLIYLGIKILLTKKKIETEKEIKKKSLSRVFWQGAIVNLLNPKSALFFFALLPQFIDAKKGTFLPQIVLLGIILLTLGFISDSIYALAAGSFRKFMQGNLTFLRIHKYFSGFIYLGLGAAAAFTGTNRK